MALLSGLRIRRCRELWCRLQMRLESRIAVALEPPYAAGAALEKAKRRKDKKRKKRKKRHMQREGWTGTGNWIHSGLCFSAWLLLFEVYDMMSCLLLLKWVIQLSVYCLLL